MPGVKSMHESDGEEIDQDTAESDKSSNDELDSSSAESGSEYESSSEMDDGSYDKRRNECLTNMSELERQFVHMKEQLYAERSALLDIKVKEVEMGTAVEYQQPLEDLKVNLENRLEVSGILRELQLENLKHYFDAESQSNSQDYESEKTLLWDSVKSDLEDKIRRLEEDNNSVDITSDLWNEQVNHRKSKRKADSFFLGKRKKPVTVSGPYIVYMLHENDILEDWTTIRKALKASKQSTERDYEFNAHEPRFKTRFSDGKLMFKGDSFRKGESVFVDDKTEKPYLANVISLNTSEVLLQKKVDKSWSRIGISELQRGNCHIQREVQ